MIAHGHLRLRTLCSPGKRLALAYLCTIRMHDQAERGLIRLRRALFGQPSRCCRVEYLGSLDFLLSDRARRGLSLLPLQRRARGVVSLVLENSKSYGLPSH